MEKNFGQLGDMRLIADQNVERGDIRFRSLDQAADRQDFYARPTMGGLFNDDGVNVWRIGADSNQPLMGSSSIESQISKISKANAFRRQEAMKFNHLTFVIQSYGAELELAEAWDFHNSFRVHATGTP